MSKVSAVRPGFVSATHAVARDAMQAEDDDAQRRRRERRGPAEEDRVTISEEALSGEARADEPTSYAPPRVEQEEAEEGAVHTALDLWLAAG